MSSKIPGDFFVLSYEQVLAAVERLGQRSTGLCYPLGSLENRVYEVELEDHSRVVAKFYRPNRHSEAALRDEHRLLMALVELEVPVCAPVPLEDGSTLGQTAAGIWYAVFPRTGGRSPDELSLDQFAQLGRLLGRMHNVSASLHLQNRPILSADTYGTACLSAICQRGALPPEVERPYREAVAHLVEVAQPKLAGLQNFVVHADCHRGNLLYGRCGFFFLDFDDMAVGPAVQDIWLLLPARPQDCPAEVDALLGGYRQFRSLEPRSLQAIEALRGLRYVCYAAWIACRIEDPAFARTYPEFGTTSYWQRQITDIYQQVRLVQATSHPDI